MRHYLDYNASAPMNENVKDYIKEIIDFYGNPSSIHTKGRRIKNILELSRKRIAIWRQYRKGRIYRIKDDSECW